MDMGEALAELSFEDALAELESIVARLESGNMTLEESLEVFERGQRLAAHCSARLEAAVLKVEQLTNDGEIVELDLD